MELKYKAKLLTAEEKEYNIDGKQIISRKARFLVEDQIFSFSVTPEQLAELEPQVGKRGDVIFAINSPKETLRATLAGFFTA